MQNGNFTHERKPQPHAAHLAASGFINPEKRLEDAVPVFRRYAHPRIGDVQNRHGLLLVDGDGDGAAGAVVLDAVFNQIEQEAVNQRVAPDDADVVAFRAERNAVLLCERRQIRQNLIRQRRERDVIRAGNGEQIAHLQQGAHERRQAAELLQQRADQLGRFGVHIGVLLGEQLQLGLQDGQRRSQLVGGVSRKLALQIKGLCQTVEHLVDGAAQLLKLPNGAFVKAQGRDAVLIDLFRLTGELPKRLQGAAGDKVGDGRAE